MSPPDGLADKYWPAALEASEQGSTAMRVGEAAIDTKALDDVVVADVLERATVELEALDVMEVKNVLWALAVQALPTAKSAAVWLK